jgi:hypothetical protein
MVGDKDDVLSMLDESRKELAGAIQGLPDDKLTAPLGENWCAKVLWATSPPGMSSQWPT